MGHTPDHLPAPPASFDLLDGTNGFAVHGLKQADFLGYFLSGDGDVNGDGLDDLVIGAAGGDPDGVLDAGESYVIFGRSGGYTAVFDQTTLNGNNGFQLDGFNTGNQAVRSNSAGDVDGDGLADIVIGEPSADPGGILDAGQGYVVRGSDAVFPPSLSLAALDGPNGFSGSGVNAGDSLGSNVGGVGDVNGDGFDDVIFEAPGSVVDGPAKAYVVFGSGQGFPASIDLATLNGANGFRLDGYQIIDSGQAGGLGDINGDGFDDLIVGGNPSKVLFGSGQNFPPNIDLTALDGNNGFQISSSAIGYFGRTVSGDFDVNGDGIADLMIGDFVADSGGAVYVVFGSQEGFPPNLDIATLDGANGFRVTGEAGAQIGWSLSDSGDVNGDGLDDILIGKKQYTTPDDYMTVIYGNVQGFAPVLDAALINGSQGFRVYSVDGKDDGDGLTMANAGDVNGDGFHDILVGSVFASPEGATFGGKAFAIFGNDFTASVTHAGTAGADTLTGTAGGDVMVGGVGDDSLRGNGGADVLKGGSGQDVLAISDAEFRQLDGGGGMDTLTVDGFNLDLSAVPDMRVSDIETIDLTDGGVNRIILEFRDMRNLSDTSNTITIIGDSGDKVIIDLTGTGLQPVDQGNGFIAYTAQAVNNGPTLLVQDSLDLSGILF